MYAAFWLRDDCRGYTAAVGMVRTSIASSCALLAVGVLTVALVAPACGGNRGARITRTKIDTRTELRPDRDRSLTKDAVVRLAGATYDIKVRTKDVDQPVLVFLEGPGAPGDASHDSWRTGLERRFVVVSAQPRYFDDGAGLELRVQRVLDLVDWARDELGAERVVLAAHARRSVAAILAAKRHPERLFAYVGVGQILNARHGLGLAGRIGSSAVATAPVSGVDVAAEVQSLEVPMFLLSGRLRVAEMDDPSDFHAGVDARQGKTLVWIDNAGWAPHREQPGRFVEVMVGRVRAVAQSGAH